MNLYQTLKEINAIQPLTTKTQIKIICQDNQIIEGNYRGYTSALDNEPEIDQIDLWVPDRGQLIGILSTEILSLERIEKTT